MRMWRFLPACAVVVLAGGVCLGQRGMGDPSGIVRQGLRPQIRTIQGEVTGVKIGPCEKTTGQAEIGSHFFLRTPEGQEYNVHLGPEVRTRDIVAALRTGRRVTARVFRTDKMAEGHAVAVTVRAGDEMYRLRQENLRPVWAGQPLTAAERPGWTTPRNGGWGGRGPCGMGRGMGMRQGGWGACGRMGRGYGWGGNGRGMQMRQRGRW